MYNNNASCFENPETANPGILVATSYLKNSRETRGCVLIFYRNKLVQPRLYVFMCCIDIESKEYGVWS